MASFLIYGANGYSGSLIAREAAARRMTAILAGRNRQATEALGRELSYETRVFSLDAPADIDAALAGVDLVLHCAGPFSHTARPMADACLRTNTHYLDITGEALVFEALALRDDEARSAGVMLLPGVGFDVVPSDCLAAHLKRRLPSATRLALGMQTPEHVSRGTATTILENVALGGLVREAGDLKRVPAAYKTRTIDLGAGPVKAMTIPWGDVATAHYSTGILNIEFYMAAPLGTRVAARLSRWFGWLLGSDGIQEALKRGIQARPPGPSADERAAGRSVLWGEVTDDAGNRAESWLEGPEPYTLTVLTSLEVVRRVLAGRVAPGFQTPSKLLGPDFVLELDGISRRDA
jgi:short subunit dehydrogenase-like uncharacterized protein